MRKIEMFTALILLTGLILKLLQVAGGEMILNLATAILAMLYYPLGFIVLNNIPISRAFKRTSYKDISSMRMIGSIGLGIAFSIVLVGSFFKFQIYQGAGPMLFLGLFFLLIGLGIVVLKYFTKQREDFYGELLLRIIILCAIGISAYLIPTNTFIDIHFRDQPEKAEVLKQLGEDPENKELQGKWRKLNEEE